MNMLSEFPGREAADESDANQPSQHNSEMQEDEGPSAKTPPPTQTLPSSSEYFN